MTREKFPEKIPFRLTRMLTNAMEVSDIWSVFGNTIQYVLLQPLSMKCVPHSEKSVFKTWSWMDVNQIQMSRPIPLPCERFLNFTVYFEDNSHGKGLWRDIWIWLTSIQLQVSNMDFWLRETHFIDNGCNIALTSLSQDIKITNYNRWWTDATDNEIKCLCLMPGS